MLTHEIRLIGCCILLKVVPKNGSTLRLFPDAIGRHGTARSDAFIWNVGPKINCYILFSQWVPFEWTSSPPDQLDCRVMIKDFSTNLISSDRNIILLDGCGCGCDPCGSSKKIKLEITEPEKKTVSRGRPKSGNTDDSHVFVKKELPDNLENTIYCTKCNTVFDNVRDLHVHEKGCYAYKRFKCKHPKCDKDFSRNSIMLQHYRSIHEGNPYKCTHCPKTFTFNKVLQNHIKVSHKSTKADFKYVCEVCSKGFDNHNHFQQHADWHTSQKRYQCAACNYKCFLTSQLNMHMRNCIEGIKYDCSECDMSFLQKQYLKNHFEKQHVDDKNCTLYCSKCIKLYKYKNSYVKHMKQEHNVESK